MPRVKKIDIRPSLPIAINTGVNIQSCRHGKIWIINGSYYGYSWHWKVNKYGNIRSMYPDLPTHEALSNGNILAVSEDVNKNKIVGIYYQISVDDTRERKVVAASLISR